MLCKGILGKAISIPALREEGDLASRICSSTATVFLSPPSARRATAGRVQGEGRAHRISIPALREEGDEDAIKVDCDGIGFLSPPSARRATFRDHLFYAGKNISIPALREEGDAASGEYCSSVRNFYPRPPRGGRRADAMVAAGLWRQIPYRGLPAIQLRHLQHRYRGHRNAVSAPEAE